MLSIAMILVFGFTMGTVVGELGTGLYLSSIFESMLTPALLPALVFVMALSLIHIFGGYDPQIMGKILVMGMTPFLIVAIDNVMIIAMNAVLQKYGGPERGDALITCNAIVQSFMLALTMPLGGISAGTRCV